MTVPVGGDDRSVLIQSTAPARRAAAIVPNDTSDNVARGSTVYVGTGGDVYATPIDQNNPVLFKNVPNGGHLPVACKRVLQSNTTATDLVALW